MIDQPWNFQISIKTGALDAPVFLVQILNYRPFQTYFLYGIYSTKYTWYRKILLNAKQDGD